MMFAKWGTVLNGMKKRKQKLQNIKLNKNTKIVIYFFVFANYVLMATKYTHQKQKPHMLSYGTLQHTEYTKKTARGKKFQ